MTENDMANKQLKLTASCHCGAVTLEAKAAPKTLTQCTCSICRRYGAQWAYYSPDDVQVNADAGILSAYVWGDRELEFLYCTRCGCLTHYASIEKDDDGRIAINGRMLSPEDTAGIPLRTFDGADTCKYLD